MLRSGTSGLPMSWTMHVASLSASISVPLAQPVIDWAAQATVKLVYRNKIMVDVLLLDLLQKGRENSIPVCLREHEAFYVEVQSTRTKAVENLCHWFTSPSGPQSTQPLTCWIHLEGPLKRVVF